MCCKSSLLLLDHTLYCPIFSCSVSSVIEKSILNMRKKFHLAKFINPIKFGLLKCHIEPILLYDLLTIIIQRFVLYFLFLLYILRNIPTIRQNYDSNFTLIQCVPELFYLSLCISVLFFHLILQISSLNALKCLIASGIFE